jgi:hypothetical protein
MKYTQCLLNKKTEFGTLTGIYWIPEKFAIQDKHIQLKDECTEKWSDGWIVKQLFSTVDESKIIGKRKDYKAFELVLDSGVTLQ